MYINIKCRKKTQQNNHVDVVTSIGEKNVSGAARQIGYYATLLCAKSAATVRQQNAKKDITCAVKTNWRMKSLDLHKKKNMYVWGMLFRKDEKKVTGKERTSFRIAIGRANDSKGEQQGEKRACD